MTNCIIDNDIIDVSAEEGHEWEPVRANPLPADLGDAFTLPLVTEDQTHQTWLAIVNTCPWPDVLALPATHTTDTLEGYGPSVVSPAIQAHYVPTPVQVSPAQGTTPAVAPGILMHVGAVLSGLLPTNGDPVPYGFPPAIEAEVKNSAPNSHAAAISLDPFDIRLFTKADACYVTNEETKVDIQVTKEGGTLSEEEEVNPGLVLDSAGQNGDEREFKIVLQGNKNVYLHLQPGNPADLVSVKSLNGQTWEDFAFDPKYDNGHGKWLGPSAVIGHTFKIVTAHGKSGGPSLLTAAFIESQQNGMPTGPECSSRDDVKIYATPDANLHIMPKNPGEGTSFIATGTFPHFIALRAGVQVECNWEITATDPNTTRLWDYKANPNVDCTSFEEYEAIVRAHEAPGTALNGVTLYAGDHAQNQHSPVDNPALETECAFTIFKIHLMVNGTDDTSDDITLLNPAQTLSVTVTCTGPGGPYQVNISLSDTSMAQLDKNAASVQSGQNDTIVITPAKKSTSPNDVEIYASFKGHVCDTAHFTIVDVVIPDTIRNADTPQGMADRIPPGVNTQFDLTVEPDLGNSGQKIKLYCDNAALPEWYGIFKVDGDWEKEYTKSTQVDLQGGQQTSPGHAGNLKLVLRVRGANVKQSNGFSVSAIPVKFEEKEVVAVPGHPGYLRIHYSFESDSGNNHDLDEVEIYELVTYPNQPNPIAPVNPPFTDAGWAFGNPTTSKIDLVWIHLGLLEDTHKIYKTDAGPAGEIVAKQSYRFHDCRTQGRQGNMSDPGYGFVFTNYDDLEIHRYVEQVGDQWQYRITKPDKKNNGVLTLTAALPCNNP